MNKTSKSFATLIAATAVAVGGVALAQSPAATPSSTDAMPKTSPPGAGCTATGNAMSAGNLGGTATNKECNTAAPANRAAQAAPAAAATTTTTTTESTASPSASTSPSTSSMAASTPPASDTGAAAAPKRVARADRG
jgi:hypothetical protein